VVRLALRLTAGGPLHCNAHDLLHGAEVQHDTRYSLRSLYTLHLCGAWYAVLSVSLSRLYRNILPANVSSSTGSRPNDAYPGTLSHTKGSRVATRPSRLKRLISQWVWTEASSMIRILYFFMLFINSRRYTYFFGYFIFM